MIIKFFFVYNSFGAEVETNLIIEHLFALNKKVYLPRVENGEMVAVPCNKNSQFKLGHFKIKEPIGKSENINNFVALVPCLAIDTMGNRFGYGGGFYDKFLQNKNAIKVALAFDFQLVDKVPTEDFDVLMDMVITNSGVHYFNL